MLPPIADLVEITATIKMVDNWAGGVPETGPSSAAWRT
jgi:hypothetical protein